MPDLVERVPYVGKDQQISNDEGDVTQVDNRGWITPVSVPPTEEEKLEEELAETKDEELDAEERTFKKRYGDLRRHTQKQLDALRSVHIDELETLKDKLSETTQLSASPLSDEELEAFQEENPEAYDVLLAVAKKEMLVSTEEIDKLKKKLEKSTYDKDVAEAERVITEQHPEWKKLTKTDEFHDWAGLQLQVIQDWIYNNPTNGELLVKAIDIYLAETGTKSSQSNKSRKLKEDASKLLPSSGGGDTPSTNKRTFTRTDIQNMPMHIYEKFESQIKDAQREGRILDE